MAIPGPLRRGYTNVEVDAMPIPLVGILLRRGPAMPTIRDEAMSMMERRIEAERLGLPMPEW